MFRRKDPKLSENFYQVPEEVKLHIKRIGKMIGKGKSISHTRHHDVRVEPGERC